MLLLALTVASLAPGDGPILAGPAFDRFVAATAAICPARPLRLITPGDLDSDQEDFIATLSRRRRARLAAVDRGEARCAGRGGLSCPVSATLEALARERLMAEFAAFACRASAATSGR